MKQSVSRASRNQRQQPLPSGQVVQNGADILQRHSKPLFAMGAMSGL